MCFTVVNCEIMVQQKQKITVYLILYIFRAVVLHIGLLLLFLPTTAQQFVLLLHVSANHRSHHQGVTFHRRTQLTVCH
jgi:hypothetical protein